MKTKAAAYLRIKAPEQTAELTDELMAHIKSAGWHTEVKWFIDQPVSKLTRPRFQDLQRLIGDGSIEHLAFLSVAQFCECVIDGLAELDVWKAEGLILSFADREGTMYGKQLAIHLDMAKALRHAMMTRATERAHLRRERANGTAMSRQKKAKKLEEQGLSVEEISNRLGVLPRTVDRMLHDKGCYYGGAAARKGARKGDTSKAFHYWHIQGMSYREIASAMGIAPGTAQRYVDEELTKRR